MLLIAAAFLLFHAHLLNADSPTPLELPDPYPRIDGVPYNYGKYASWDAPNGKLHHDMRTFSSITFDWSSQKFDGIGDFIIPKCHEYRLRSTFFEASMSNTTLLTKSMEFMNTFTSGHFVYPLILTVQDGASPILKSHYYAVAVHKGFEFMEISSWQRWDSHPPGMKPDFVQLVIVTEGLWRTVWSRWIQASSERRDLCEETTYFDNLIPIINRSAQSKPQYEDIVGTYSDVISSESNPSGCGAPTNQQETLTFGYPTAEGAHQLLITPHVNGFISSIRHCRESADSIMQRCLRDYYYRTLPKAQGTYVSPQARFMFFNYSVPISGNMLMEDENFSPEGWRRLQCVFRAPFC